MITATPETIAATLKALPDGGALKLVGEFPRLRIADKHWPKGITIDARGATLTDWYWNWVSGVSILGGTWKPSTSGGYALRIDGASRITIDGAVFQGLELRAPGEPYHQPDGGGLNLSSGSDVLIQGCEFVSLRRGIALGQIDGFEITDSDFRRLLIDGIAMGNCWNGLIEDNTFSESVKLTKDHGDCVQMWSRPDHKPTSDITIRRNTIMARGQQGITGFNHVRDGVNDGGFDRITISQNRIACANPQALALVEARNSTVISNNVRTLMGAASRASITLRNCPDMTRLSNTVGAGAGKPAAAD